MLKHISLLPKLDKFAYIQSYLEVQRKHAAAFADEGNAHIRTWTSPPDPPSPTTLPNDYGFGTPVLKPRVPQDTANDDNKENAPVKVKKPRCDVTNSKRTQSTKHSPVDNDQVIRLAERREKKRVKRAAMQPSGDDLDQDHNEDSKRVNSKSKFSAGLALMHGFSATNIGKNRLTLKTVPKMGVFTKGKASAPARVAKKIRCKGQEVVRFSESEFLNRNLEPSSDSSSSSDAGIKSSSGHPLTRNKASSHGPPSGTPSKSKLESLDNRAPKKAEIAVSEIWNIEHEEFILPSNSTRSDILDTKRFSWNHEDEQKDRSLSEISEMQLVHRSSSLGPSQSASQCHPLPPVVSKYFSIHINQSPLYPLPSPSKVQSLPFVTTPQPEMLEIPWQTSPSGSYPFEQAQYPFSSQLHIEDMKVLDRVSVVFDDLDVVSDGYRRLSADDQVHTSEIWEPFLQTEGSYEPSIDSGIAAAEDGAYEFKEFDCYGDTFYHIADTFSCDGMSWTGNDDWLEDGMAIEECNFDSVSFGHPGFPDHRMDGDARTDQSPFFISDDCYDTKSDISMSAVASLPFCQGKELLHGLSECGRYQTDFTVTSAEIETPLVKVEPAEEAKILKASDSFNQGIQPQTPVKKESKEAARVFIERGLPVPQYLQGVSSSYIANPQAPVASDATDNDVAMNDAPISVSLFFTTYESVSDISYTPEASFKEGLGMVKTIRTNIEKLRTGSKLRQDPRSLESQTSPKTLVAVCGGTGTGKSTLLNAVLDDNIVPTSGMRACTAVVTEISYHEKRTIDADVSFLSEEEWREELAVLLSDLVDEDGNLKRSSDLKSDAGVAWSKVNGVYPKLSQERLANMTPDQIIAHDPRIAKLLGSTEKIVANDSKIFAKKIAKYIDSKDQNRGKKKKNDDRAKDSNGKGKLLMDKARGKEKKNKDDDVDEPAYWPLIKQVHIRCSSPSLATGAILVDLPGVADANAARNNIAKDYMKKCNCIWIVAPITRAVDDKTARDLLGEAFRLQLMNGSYDPNTITFVATKCDDVSCSEVIRSLNLQGDEILEDIEARIEANTIETRTYKKEKSQSEKLVKAISKEMEHMRACIKEHEEHLDCLRDGEEFSPKMTKATKDSKKRKNRRGGKQGSAKRHRSNDSDEDDDSELDNSETESSNSDVDSDDGLDNSDSESESDHESENEEVAVEEVTEEILKEKITTLRTTLKDARARHTTARQQKKKAADALGRLSKALGKLQREKNGFCSLKRSEFSRDVLKEDFRTGLKDLDDAAAEARDPDNFDPTVDQRNYEAIDLPVFTISSRDYMRLKGQVEGDGKASCFSNVEDTGVLELQAWCHTLTSSSRQRNSRSFLGQLQTFATSVHTYVRGFGEVTPADRAVLRERWESTPQNDESDAGLDPNDPWAQTLGGTLYALKPEPPKVNAYGQLIGVTPELAKEFTQVVDKTVEELKTLFRDGLEEKCHEGAANAASSAVETSDEFAASMHWGTYRATLRRHGTYRRDLNMELLAPFTKNIAASWGKMFENDLFSPFEKATESAITELLQKVEESAAPGLKDRVKLQGELCLEEAKVALKKAADGVRDAMQAEQKEISRSLSPHVQAQLVDGYDRAMEERGIGSVARQKAVFHSYVSDCKDTIFEDGATVIMENLNKAAEAVGAKLDEALGQLSEKVEVNLAVLWESTRDDPQHVAARERVANVVSEVLKQTKLWIEAEKLTRDTDVEMA